MSSAHDRPYLKYCNLDDFKWFINNAVYDEKFVYFEGYYLEETPLSREIGRIAYNSALQGKIYLFQKKLRDKFLYIAIKASSIPAVKLIPFSSEKLKEKRVKFYA